MPKVAPSILSADFLHLDREVEMLNANADYIHLDVMDGVFVQNISFGFPVIQSIAKAAKLPLDVHLMIVNPDKYIDRFAKAGANMLSFHIKAVNDPAPVLYDIRQKGMKPGLVINPDVPVQKLYPYLELCSHVVVMSVFAGFGGQKFIESSYDRIRMVKQEIVSRGLDIPIEVDGGVTMENAAAVSAAGADILVAGTCVFKADDPAGAIGRLRSL